MCDNSSFGCTVVVKLECLAVHREECEHNPKKPVPCEQGCGLVIPKDELRVCVYFYCLIYVPCLFLCLLMAFTITNSCKIIN